MVFHLEWFREAKRLLEVYQDKIKKEEDEKYQQERAKVRSLIRLRPVELFTCYQK